MIRFARLPITHAHTYVLFHTLSAGDDDGVDIPDRLLSQFSVIHMLAPAPKALKSMFETMLSSAFVDAPEDTRRSISAVVSATLTTLSKLGDVLPSGR